MDSETLDLWEAERAYWRSRPTVDWEPPPPAARSPRTTRPRQAPPTEWMDDARKTHALMAAHERKGNGRAVVEALMVQTVSHPWHRGWGTRPMLTMLE